jgi:hypothetical protein
VIDALYNGFVVASVGHSNERIFIELLYDERLSYVRNYELRSISHAHRIDRVIATQSVAKCDADNDVIKVIIIRQRFAIEH